VYVVSPDAVWYELCKMQNECKAQIKVYVMNTLVCSFMFFYEIRVEVLVDEEFLTF
jgi:hypothetical protein